MPNSSFTNTAGTFDAYLKSSKKREAVVLTPASSGGNTPFHRVLTADNNAAIIKGSAGQVYNIWGWNMSVSGKPFFLKLYDQTALPSNPAILTPKCVFGFGPDIHPPHQFVNGLEFVNGIVMVAVLGGADNDNTPIALAGDGFIDLAFE